MSDNNVTIMPPGGALTRATSKPNPATVGLTLINGIFNADVMQALSDAKRFSEEAWQAPRLCYHNGGIGEAWLEAARPLHARWLNAAPRAAAAERLLLDIHFELSPISQAEASAMLRFLFAAKGRKRGDEAAAKLAACINMFTPTSNALAEVMGLWKPVPRHPLVLALAIQALMAKRLHEPEECELREELATVKQRLDKRGSRVGEWQQTLGYADETVFAFDRPAWDAAYATADSAVVLAMLDDIAPSPRCAVLKALHEQKVAQEEEAAAALAEHDRPALAAACDAKAAKRTKKLNTKPKTEEQQ
jgi:hypothetical protein